MRLIRFNGIAFDADRIVRILYGTEADNQYAMIDLDTPVIEIDEDDDLYETTTLQLEGVDAVLFVRWLERNAEDIAQIPTISEPSTT